MEKFFCRELWTIEKHSEINHLDFYQVRNIFLLLFVVHACLGFLTEIYLNDRWSEAVYRWTELIAQPHF